MTQNWLGKRAPNNFKKCEYPNCKNTRGNYVGKFFGFPADPNTRPVWLEICNKPNLLALPLKQLRDRLICDKHFALKQFINSTRQRLIRKAIPKVYSDIGGSSEEEIPQEKQERYEERSQERREEIPRERHFVEIKSEIIENDETDTEIPCRSYTNTSSALVDSTDDDTTNINESKNEEINIKLECSEYDTTNILVFESKNEVQNQIIKIKLECTDDNDTNNINESKEQTQSINIKSESIEKDNSNMYGVPCKLYLTPKVHYSDSSNDSISAQENLNSDQFLVNNY